MHRAPSQFRNVHVDELVVVRDEFGVVVEDGGDVVGHELVVDELDQQAGLSYSAITTRRRRVVSTSR